MSKFSGAHSSKNILSYIPCLLTLTFLMSTLLTLLMFLPPLPFLYLSHLRFTPVEVFHDSEPVGLCIPHCLIQLLLSPLRSILKQIDIHHILLSKVKYFIQCQFVLTQHLSQHLGFRCWPSFQVFGRYYVLLNILITYITIRSAGNSPILIQQQCFFIQSSYFFVVYFCPLPTHPARSIPITILTVGVAYWTIRSIWAFRCFPYNLAPVSVVLTLYGYKEPLLFPTISYSL